jgi:hypothetical protein
VDPTELGWAHAKHYTAMNSSKFEIAQAKKIHEGFILLV